MAQPWTLNYLIFWVRNLILVLLAKAFIPQEDSGETEEEIFEHRRWYWDNVALALRGYKPSFFFDGVGWRPHMRLLLTNEKGVTCVAKRFPKSNEIKMLKLLTSDDFDDPANATAFPTGLYNFGRVLITPRFYIDGDIKWTPIRVLDFAHQLFQGLTFMHERRVAHLDLNTDNVVFATPEPGRFKLLLIDFEFSGFFPNEASPRVTLPDMENTPPPPEGFVDIDPFAYDVYQAAHMIFSVKQNTYNCEGFELPTFLVDMLQEMTSEDPTSRPTMRRCLTRFNEYIQQQGEKYTPYEDANFFLFREVDPLMRPIPRRHRL